MIIVTEKYSSRERRLSQWHEYFAWTPVMMDGYIVWFSTIERRFDDERQRWEYRIPEESVGHRRSSAMARAAFLLSVALILLVLISQISLLTAVATLIVAIPVVFVIAAAIYLCVTRKPSGV